MSTRRAIKLAALMLALANLAPASALAGAGGADRPVHAKVTSGSAMVRLDTGHFENEFSGTASQIGKYTAHAEGSAVFVPRFFGTGTVTIVAANGDEITGTFTATTADPSPDVHTGTSITTITGGTGRFTDATGILVTTVASHSLEVVGTCPACAVVRNDDVGTVTGTISY